MIIYDDKRMTANQCAKLIVLEFGENTCDLDDNMSIEFDRLTERDIRDLETAINKHLIRVRKFLGVK